MLDYQTGSDWEPSESNVWRDTRDHDGASARQNEALGVSPLSSDIAAILAQLRQVAVQLAVAEKPVAASQNTAKFIRMLLQLRRQRGLYFSGDVFGEPVWEMLLELAASRTEKRNVTIADLCKASGVPTATAFRNIKDLVAHGLLERRKAAGDGRKIFITLSEDIYGCMTGYLDIMQIRMRQHFA